MRGLLVVLSLLALPAFAQREAGGLRFGLPGGSSSSSAPYDGGSTQYLAATIIDGGSIFAAGDIRAQGSFVFADGTTANTAPTVFSGGTVASNITISNGDPTLIFDKTGSVANGNPAGSVSFYNGRFDSVIQQFSPNLYWYARNSNTGVTNALFGIHNRGGVCIGINADDGTWCEQENGNSLFVNGPSRLDGGLVVHGASTFGGVIDAGSVFVAGNATVTGASTLTGALVFGSETLAPFAGGGQANATQITKPVVFANPATSNDSLKLPTAAAGMQVVVCNTNGGVSTNVAVFGQSGSSMNGTLNGSRAFTGTSGNHCKHFYAASSTAWWSN